MRNFNWYLLAVVVAWLALTVAAGLAVFAGG